MSQARGIAVLVDKAMRVRVRAGRRAESLWRAQRAPFQHDQGWIASS